MPETRFTAKNLARRGHFEPFGGRFFRLTTCNAFWHGGQKLTPKTRLAISF